jgi:hypothetical protein
MADSTANGKIVVDFSKLTLRDLARARVVLGGKDPYEVANGDDVVQLIVWCVRSRSQPDLPWDAALDVEVGELQFPVAVPPQTPPPARRGRSPRRSGGRTSRAKPSGGEPEPPSAATTTSTATSTSS